MMRKKMESNPKMKMMGNASSQNPIPKTVKMKRNRMRHPMSLILAKCRAEL